MKTRITLPSLKQHFSYDWWKYLLVLAVGLFSVSLLYSCTAPKPPREKTLVIEVYGFMPDSSPLTAVAEEIRTADIPGMEAVQVNSLLPDDAYGTAALTTYFAARQGDLFILPREVYLQYSSNGFFLPLEEDPELMEILRSADLQRGWRRNTQTGESHLYGIPLDQLPGLSQYLYVENGFVSVYIGNCSDEASLQLLRSLCRRMLPD